MLRVIPPIFATFALLWPVSGDEPAVEHLVGEIESVTGAMKHVYCLRDDGGRSMDCVEIFQPAGHGYKGVYGIHHTRAGGVFSIHLAHSMDLIQWKHVVALDDHASQPAIWETHLGGYLVAYEKDAPNSCWMRIRFYKNLPQLRAGRHAKGVDIPRSLAPTAEGTPSFESVKMDGDDLSNSEIRLRFHYFKGARVDQLARGTLKNFKTWTSEADEKASAALRELGGAGNLGDRDPVTFENRRYYLQEVQTARGDWSSWGIYLCDQKGLPLRKLAIGTHKRATSFSNPSASWFVDAGGRSRLAVSMFLHSKGNDRSEAGQLLYVVDPDPDHPGG